MTNYQSENRINPLIGMSQTDKQRYSVVKFVDDIIQHGKPEGLEGECHRSVERHCKQTAQGFWIPGDITANLTLSRALNATTLTAGGALTGLNVDKNIVELLRDAPICARMGATVLNGLNGPLALPRQTSGGTASTLSESGQTTMTDAAFGQLVLTPKRVSAGTSYSRELFYQASPDVEQFVRADLAAICVIKQDNLCLNGVGGLGEPVGLLNTTGVQTVTFGAAANWSKILDFSKKLKESKVPIANAGWLSTPAVEAKWKQAVRYASTASPLWTDESTVDGKRAETTTQLATGGTNDRSLLVNWSDFVMGNFWSGIDLVVDPYSAKKSAQIEVVINLWFDCGLRHSVSAVISTDSAAQ